MPLMAPMTTPTRIQTIRVGRIIDASPFIISTLMTAVVDITAPAERSIPPLPEIMMMHCPAEAKTRMEAMAAILLTVPIFMAWGRKTPVMLSLIHI